MKRLVLPCLALGFVFFAAGCGDSVDSCGKDMTKYVKELADTLEDVKTKADYDKVKDKVEAIMKKMEGVVDRVATLAKDKKKEDLKASSKVVEDAKEAGKKLDQVLNRLPAEVKQDVTMKFMGVAMKLAPLMKDQ